jgi:hypothetical protein
LAGLKNLRHIHINASNLTDDGLALLSRLPNIEELSLQENHFSDAGLARLQGKERLKRLAIGMGDNQLGDAGPSHLQGFKKLVLLDLQNSQVTSRGLESIKQLPSLKSLCQSAPLFVPNGPGRPPGRPIAGMPASVAAWLHQDLEVVDILMIDRQLHRAVGSGRKRVSVFEQFEGFDERRRFATIFVGLRDHRDDVCAPEWGAAFRASEHRDAFIQRYAPEVRRSWP